MKKFIGLIVCAVLVSTFVYAGGKKHAKKEKKRPSAEEVKSLEKITLSFEVKDGDIHFNWTPATSKESAGVKLVYSSEEKSPLYPFERYANWMPGNGHSECVVPNSKAASDEKRYYRVCSVKQNHREYVALSNVVEVPAIERTTGKDKSNKKEASANNKCPGCGKKYLKEDSYCSKCGKKLK